MSYERHAALVQELEPHVLNCVFDSNGNHVSKIFFVLSSSLLSHLVSVLGHPKDDPHSVLRKLGLHSTILRSCAWSCKTPIRMPSIAALLGTSFGGPHTVTT